MDKIELEKLIIRPLVTEKSTLLKESNKYVFLVNKKANKNDVVRAVESKFGVKVIKCNVANMRGKRKKVRYKVGKTASRKKAIVTLQKGQEMPFFEGV